MASLEKIAAHWSLGDEPFCVHCRRLAPARSWCVAGPYLQRAHVIDRSAGGLDHAGNLLPLCRPCHLRQPEFAPEEAELALYWFFDGLWPVTESLERIVEAWLVKRQVS